MALPAGSGRAECRGAAAGESLRPIRASLRTDCDNFLYGLSFFKGGLAPAAAARWGLCPMMPERAHECQVPRRECSGLGSIESEHCTQGKAVTGGGLASPPPRARRRLRRRCAMGHAHC